MKAGNDSAPNTARQLLEALYRQRTELGDIANDLISLLQAAGVSIPYGSDDPYGGSPPE
jgi:hypothetical protein